MQIQNGYMPFLAASIQWATPIVGVVLVGSSGSTGSSSHSGMIAAAVVVVVLVVIVVVVVVVVVVPMQTFKRPTNCENISDF